MFLALLAALAPPAFEVRERIALPGGEAWGHPAFDKPSHHLFVPREGHIQIVDVEAKRLVGDVTGLAGARDVVLVPERDLGFASVRDADEILVFDLTNGAEIKRIPVQGGPDALAYDPRTRRVLVATRKGLTPIDAINLSVGPRVDLGGVPTGVVVADRGTALVALGERGIDRLDLARSRVSDHWPQPATGLAYDGRRSLLYALAGDSVAILDAKSGKPRGRVAVGKDLLAVLSDFELGLAFALGADGTLSVVHARSAAAVQTLATAPTATSAAIDPDDHRLYLLAREAGKVSVLVVARVPGQ